MGSLFRRYLKKPSGIEARKGQLEQSGTGKSLFIATAKASNFLGCLKENPYFRLIIIVGFDP
ncbi:hypothetical protein KY289_013542 [Solanum tuberosum]|nr:hypothetical protein KY289_013542 [Solanum tuberosum]